MRLSRLSASLLGVPLLLAMSVGSEAAGPKAIGTITFVGRPGLVALPVVDFQWAARNTSTAGAGGGGAAGKTTFDGFRVTKLVDGSSPLLLELVFGGTTIPEVRIDVTIRRGTTASYVLSDVVVSADERRLRDGVAPVLQDVTLAARAVRETIASPGGTVTTCFDLALGKTCP